jgi:D-cysteine desulfhydrase
VPREAVVVLDDYVGPGYSLPTAAMVEAVQLFARHEGILLDPVYTGKTAAGLIGLVREGRFARGERVAVPAHGRLAGALRLPGRRPRDAPA